MENSNPMNKTKKESKLGNCLGAALAITTASCIAALLISLTAKIIFWMF